MDITDVAIVGGGPAGLTATNTVARQLHTAVVYDNSLHRNAGVNHMHMILTWDHKDPEDYRSAARKNILDNYSTVQFVAASVDRIEKKANHFEVQDSNGGTKKFRKLILAAGSSTIYPQIQGYDKLWKKRIFHCLFCHGYEDRGGTSLGVLAVGSVGGAMAAHMAQNAAQLTDKVTLYSNGDDVMTTEVKAAISRLIPDRFSVEPRKIKQLTTADDADNTVAIEFEDGTTKVETFLVHNPETKASGPFVTQLGLETTPAGDIKADYPFWGTSVPGVYAVGDCSTPYKVTPSSITSGCNAAVAVCAELQAAKYTQPSGSSL